jgi:hypothetical protein
MQVNNQPDCVPKIYFLALFQFLLPSSLVAIRAGSSSANGVHSEFELPVL